MIVPIEIMQTICTQKSVKRTAANFSLNDGAR